MRQYFSDSCVSYHLFVLWASQLGMKNTPTVSLQRGKTSKCPGYDTKQSDG